MKRKGLVIGAILIISFLIIGIVSANSDWTKLGEEDLRIVSANPEAVIVINALQDVEKDKIAKFIDKNPGAERNWNGVRPDFVNPAVLKLINKGNSATSNLTQEDFSVRFEDVDGNKEIKLKKLTVNNKNLIAPTDLDNINAPFGLVFSPDNSKALIPTLKGLWLVDATTKQGRKISTDNYNGQTQEQLLKNIQELTSGSEGPATLWWYNRPVFNKSGDKIVFGTNRDCTVTGGSSLWEKDMQTNDEKPILKGSENIFFNAISWIDDGFILVEKWNGMEKSYLVSDLSGNVIDVNMEGNRPEILGVLGNLVAYVPNNDSPTEFVIAKIDLNTKTLVTIYNKKVEGFIQKWAEYSPFNFDGSRVAVLYRVNEEGDYHIFAKNLLSSEETTINNVPSWKSRIASFNWIDNERLLVRVQNYSKFPSQISSWIYTLKGGE